jgi:hypothetical protein
LPIFFLSLNHFIFFSLHRHDEIAPDRTGGLAGVPSLSQSNAWSQGPQGSQDLSLPLLSAPRQAIPSNMSNSSPFYYATNDQLISPTANGAQQATSPSQLRRTPLVRAQSAGLGSFPINGNVEGAPDHFSSTISADIGSGQSNISGNSSYGREYVEGSWVLPQPLQQANGSPNQPGFQQGLFLGPNGANEGNWLPPSSPRHVQQSPNWQQNGLLAGGDMANGQLSATSFANGMNQGSLAHNFQPDATSLSSNAVPTTTDDSNPSLDDDIVARLSRLDILTAPTVNTQDETGDNLLASLSPASSTSNS